MVPPDLISYIKEQSADGVSATELREALMEAGWNEHDIENALHDVAAKMEPLTVGASLHEDVAQVRGLVAHLASRVQRLEVRLTGSTTATLPSELPSDDVQNLPSGAVGPERVLAAGLKPNMVMRVVAVLGALGVLSAFGFYFQKLVSASQQAPMAFLQVAALVGFLHLLLAWVMMRRRWAFSAELAAATGVAFWSLTVWHAWRTYHYMEASTAAAIGLLMVVILVVMGRWIDRYSEGK